MFVANTANRTIIEVPVNGDGTAGTPVLFTTGINAPDGLAIDADDNIWIAANQEDEIVVVDPTGKVIAKLGDFDGISSPMTISGSPPIRRTRSWSWIQPAKSSPSSVIFDGISKDGTPRGLLFPTSPAFSRDGKYIYTPN